jgi:hypothetical protein
MLQLEKQILISYNEAVLIRNHLEDEKDQLHNIIQHIDDQL